MPLFYKHKPRGFNYIPRYFDPEKEARERRKAELGLASNASHDDDFRARMHGSLDTGRSRNNSGMGGSKLFRIVLIVGAILVAFRYLAPVMNRLLEYWMGN